ncbi:hypothetical protein [Aquipseudomonas ullengensis]|uniref:Uncharacterized protein n=1 Tax=Aquipseudomonas ullengensis TaxID=2759166 RepID=A0A7W4LP05_9GAMM|nr:hypothetical protein [Pseudomonas ullengensis]MBB2496686.1 hypothetical protein [Pseudomonas ullengensis]
MDYATINGVVQAVNLTKQLAKAAFDGKVDADAKAKIGEVVEKLGDVQDRMFNLRNDLHELQTERDELKTKLDAADAWERRASNYNLTQTLGGAVVYSSKGDPIHYACPSCFNKREIHPLQDNRTVSGKFRCTGCAAEFPVKPKHKVTAVPTTHHWND